MARMDFLAWIVKHRKNMIKNIFFAIKFIFLYDKNGILNYIKFGKNC